jgi:hypothetical protein
MATGREQGKGDVMGLLSKIAKVAKAVVKSPITKVAAGGVAIICPPVGISALAGLAAADKVVDAVDAGNAVRKQVAAGLGGRAGVPGGREPVAAALGQVQKNIARAKQGQTAAGIVKATAAAAKSDPDAARALATMKLVQAAKQGKPQAKLALLQQVRKQVAATIAAGVKPGATTQEKQASRLVTALVKETAARKRISRRFGVDKRNARVVRVA